MMKDRYSNFIYISFPQVLNEKRSVVFFLAGIGEFNSSPCHGDRTCDAHIETEY